MYGMSDQDVERLRAQLRELTRNVERQQPSPKLEAALCERFRAYHRGRRAKQILTIGSIAACLTIVFAGGTLLVRRSMPTAVPAAETGPQVASPVRRQPEPQPGFVGAPSMQVRQRARPARPKRRPAPEVQVEQEVMTSFIPVGVGAAFGPGERGSLVRVRLPRSALATFGLPVNENRAADVVNADVLLGEDGLARAIRFVQ